VRARWACRVMLVHIAIEAPLLIVRVPLSD
jgi:hypothetical protein